MLWKMAWRNLWRHRRRTFINLGSVAFGVWLTITAVGLGDYSYLRTINDSARMGFGHVTVQPEGYQASPSLEKRISDTNNTLSRVLEIDGVDHGVVRIIGQSMLASASKTVGGAFIAVDPSLETPEVNLFIRALKRGEMFSGTAGREAVIGSLMAEKLNLDLGKKLVLTAVDKNGEVVSELFRVKGIFKTSVTEVDSSTLLVPIDRIRKTLGYGADEATMISAYVEDYRKSRSVRDLISASVAPQGAEVATWRETQSELASLSDVDRGMNVLFLALLGVLISAGILNTSLMSVLERKQEFGMMLAVGMRPAQLAGMVLTESFFIGALGLCIGSLLCAPWIYYLLEVGLDMSSMMGTDYSAGGVLIDPILHIELYWQTILITIVGLLVLSMGAALYPAVSAARIPPIDVIKKVA